MNGKLLRSPDTNQVFFTDSHHLYAIDGTPYSLDRASDWPSATKELDEPFTLFDWQASPGDYGPHYVVARLTDQRSGLSFTAGGSVVYIRAWAHENWHKVTLLVCYADRNEARAQADVQW